MVSDKNASAHGLSVRARVLSYLLVLTAGALAIAGSTAYLIERDSIKASITAELTARANDYLRWTSETTPTSIDVLMREAVGRYTGTADEGAVAIIDGAPRYVPASEARVRLEDDAEFVAAVWEGTTDEVVVERLTTASADYAYAAMPFVDASGSRIAVFTVAIDEGARLRDLSATFTVYAVVALVALAAIGALGFFTVGQLLAPIRLLDQTARSITDADLSQRVPIVGDDDLARLSGTVNAMLDRVEGAFEGQRRLLDDASHELRTPLTIVRARLELLEPRDAEQVEATRVELLDVVNDMSRLVEDLMVLAKADRPDFIRIVATDVGALTRSALGRMEALAPRTWVLDGCADGEAVLDAQRVTQGWLQLAANAVKFSDEGTTVRVGSDRDGSDLVIWVSDEGRGIAADDLERVRERFIRLDPDTEGLGLGLPLVSAIARAHGGDLEISSTLGVGSTFVIRIPWKEAP